MRIRHKIPTIFNLSMVDVLCCALGCCILLWLLNLKEARERSQIAGKTSEELTATQAKLAAMRQALEAKSQLARSVEVERNRLSEELSREKAALGALQESLSSLKAKYSLSEEQVAKLTRDRNASVKEREQLSRSLRSTSEELRQKETLAQASGRRVEELTTKLRDTSEQVRQLQADLQSSRGKLTAAEALAETAQRSIDTLRLEKRALADEASRARAAIENRFEGIALTGRRVVFLVDMSGSMELVDSQTPSASKWIGVRENLAKIMRSLPDLERFQLIVFAEKVSYPLGQEGRWLVFDPKTSVDQTVNALAAIKPTGGTNMHDPMESAFRFREQGLDTIYLFSDGLPNLGPGLTRNEAATLKEAEQADILARYIRNRLRQDWNRDIAGRPRVRINTVGFFFESPDVGAFLWALARENDGGFVGMSKP
jgi:hypothetical protein